MTEDRTAYKRSGDGFSMRLVASFAILAAAVMLAVESVKSSSSTIADTPGAFVPWQSLALFVTGALVVSVFLRRFRARIAWELILTVIQYFGAWLYLWLLLPAEAAIFFAALLTVLQGLIRRVAVHDAFIAVGAAGTAIVLGFSLPERLLIVILVGLAIYDSFSKRTENFIDGFAASLMHRGVLPALVLPTRWRVFVHDLHVAIRGSDVTFVGLGEMVLPLALVARASIQGLTSFGVVTVGLLVAVGWYARRPRSVPMMVPVAVGSVIPYLLLYVFA